MDVCTCPCHSERNRCIKCCDGAYQAGLQKVLDIVNENFDARKPEDDIIEIIARIITDLQHA